INMVPIRADLSEDITFTELMQQLHKAGMEALTHQEYPFPEMVKSLRETGWGGSSDTPLFQTSFVLQNWAKGFDKNLADARDESAGFTLEPILSIQQEEDFNLALEVLDLEAFQFFFKYDTGLYRRDTIARMAGHFNTLLLGIAEDPGRKISRLPLFTDADRREVLEGWNDTQTEFPDGICLHQLMEAQAEKTPGATAIIFGEEELSYAALNQRANQIGQYLRKAGVGPGTRVAVCMERSVNMVLGILGILKAGGAYVPVDPAYPEDRIRYMLDDSAAPVIVTEIQRLDALPEHDAKVICLDAEASAIDNEEGENFSCGVTAADLAYVIYTSGSTGKPKGVMIRHRGLPNLARAQIRLFGVEPSSRVLQFASMSFDASISEIAMALCSGAALCLASKSELMPGDALEETLVRHAVTHVTLPPTALAVMTPERLTTLSTIVVAGEACPPELAAIWSENRIFINAYGPTEGTVCASGMRYDGGNPDRLSIDRLPIGKPIANTRLYILDRHLQPVPVGVPGELHIAGVGLAKGYLNRPDLTEEKFIPNPFASEGEDDYRRIYKTGDLCRYLPDGHIEFLGRMDHQVKIRGFRIEPGEIEAVLRAHGQVRDALVDVRKSGNGERQLVAYVTPEEVRDAAEHLPTQSELRAHLKTALPDFMIPAPFVWLEAMPLTPNGKIDRHALPAPDPSLIREQAFVAPETKTQKMLAGIFSDVLKTENISIHDDFFMMGGHSLLATVVISRIQKAFKTELPITGIFNHPTIAGLSRYLEDLMQNRSAGYNAIPAVDREKPLELSFGQQRLWFLDKFEGGAFASYNVPIAFRVAGKIDVPAVNRAINEIIRRHEVLRTVFRDPLNGLTNDQVNDPDGDAAAGEASAPLQIILPELKVGLTLMDIAELPEEDREEKVAGIVSEESLTPFDLSDGPLIRAMLVRMADEEQLLMVTLHHIVFDGWSVGVFFKEFAALYGAYALNKPSPLRSPDIQYADFAAWQRRTLNGDVFARQLKYWENQLAGIPLSTELPTDRPRPPVQTFNGGVVPFTIGPELTGRLNTLSRKSGVTLFMTLYAAFATLLSRYSGKTDIVIGSPVAGRTHVQTEELIGFFVNTLALRADLSEDPRFSDFLVRVKENVLSAYENQDLPFERLIQSDVLNVERSMSQSPLFQVMFDLYNVSDGTATASGGRFDTGGLHFSPYDIDYEVAKFDLTLSMIAETDKITARFQYNSDLFDRTTIERSVGHFLELLADIADTPDKPLSRLSILPREEKEQLLTEFNHTSADFPDDILIYERFEANVLKTPDAPAVVFQDGVLTYRELNERANRTGHYLQKLGVGPDVLVGLYMERSFEMITGVLGILKAGGAYVPLDPSYPADRIAYIMEDTNAPIILTQDRLLASLPDTQARPVCMDTDWVHIDAEDSKNVVNDTTPDHMCYVIYTSGTTGRPKGVMIEHRSVCARLSFWQGIYGLNTEDVAVHYRPYSFDGSTEEYLLPLWVGAKFIMAPSNIAVTDNIADYLITTIETYGITKINMPPVLLDVFLTVLKKSGIEKVRSLHTVVSGGDKLTADIARKFEALFDTAYLYNTYGPTENSIDSLNWRCDMAAGNGRVLLGKSIANTKSYIVDGNGALVPLGVPGELTVSGIGLARGYLNRPNLTKAVFIPNPFSERPGSRIYKTGDLCRCLPDGNIEFLGRIDHQVKIRGFRIELGEIESVLSRHELVNETVVLAREDQPGNKQLAAYVVPIDPDQRPEEADVRAFLRTILPDYMIPAFIVFMDELPLTPNGKIDRKALPVPVLSQSGNAYTAPGTRNEKILAQIWAETLGVPRVGINDNFFALGGDSIISIRVISRASDKGLSFTVKQIFEHQTLGELARAAGVRKHLAAEQGIITGAVPLTPMMERLFSAPCIDPHHFNQYLVVRISDTWDAGMLGWVFSAMLTQHDALRLQFARDDGAWSASIADATPETGARVLTVTDVSGLPPKDRMAAMEDKIKRHQEGFDLSAGSLLKAILF
ncbi:MAG: amino acid adenylation domain-containing protein, partial [Desulfobacterales bacterium]|nr:amino acid adenylation domain-containing protein [Desulfobacterales bacterium]